MREPLFWKRSTRIAEAWFGARHETHLSLDCAVFDRNCPRVSLYRRNEIGDGNCTFQTWSAAASLPSLTYAWRGHRRRKQRRSGQKAYTSKYPDHVVCRPQVSRLPAAH